MVILEFRLHFVQVQRTLVSADIVSERLRGLFGHCVTTRIVTFSRLLDVPVIMEVTHNPISAAAVKLDGPPIEEGFGFRGEMGRFTIKTISH